MCLGAPAWAYTDTIRPARGQLVRSEARIGGSPLPAPVASCALGSSDGANDPGYSQGEGDEDGFPDHPFRSATSAAGCQTHQGPARSRLLHPRAGRPASLIPLATPSEAVSIMATSMPQAHYTEEEWRPSAGHRPLGGLPLEQLMLLHRHWIWANRQRELFEAELVAGRPPGWTTWRRTL